MSTEKTARLRFREVTLEFPVEAGGKLWESVFVHRMTAGEVRDFVEAAREAMAEGKRAALPMVKDGAGKSIPVEILDQFDADDFEAIDEAARDFLPRQLKEAAERSLATGEATSQPSQPSSPASETPSSSTGES